MGRPILIGTSPQPTTIDRLPPGQIRLDPSYGASLVVLLEADPDQSPGVGGFQTTTRSGRGPASYFVGPDDNGQLTLQLAFDTRVLKKPIMDIALDRVRLMGRRHKNHDEPPKIQITGLTIPLAREGRWVIQPGGLQLGAQVTRNGELVRQSFSLALQRHTPVGALDRVRLHKTRDKANRRRTRTYTTRKGDTLRGIAVRQLGDPGEWKTLRANNRKRLKGIDPDDALDPGIEIKIK